MPLMLHNSLTRRREPFEPADEHRITMYTCGPTVYDDAHIGNFRSFLAADVLRRWLESPLRAEGARVIHVMNITDVGHMTEDDAPDGEGEDKMAAAGRRLTEAKKAGSLPAGAGLDPGDPASIARFYEARFRQDAVRLGLKVISEAETDPTLTPRATECVPAMIRTIATLIERGHAYVTGPEGERAVYFDVRSFPPYGRLSGNTLDKLREGAGGRVKGADQAGKRHPADFLLWRENPAHLMQWPSPWGRGYPGWHIECSVMAFERLVGEDSGDRSPDAPLIDVHTGGEDNIFPHHECEIAQSCCAFYDNPQAGSLARYWFHPRFLLVEGEKMSKSKGNFYTARELFEEGHEPAALRLELIKTHYRSNANFTMQGLKDSQRIVGRWREAASRAAHRATDLPSGQCLGELSAAERDAIDRFTGAMNDDLNVAGAMAVVNEWIGAGGDGRIVRDCFAPVLGIDLTLPAPVETDLASFAPGLEPTPDLEALLRDRKSARADGDYARADAIRDELAAMGYAIQDAPGGKVEVRRAL